MKCCRCGKEINNGDTYSKMTMKYEFAKSTSIEATICLCGYCISDTDYMLGQVASETFDKMEELKGV